MPPADEHVRPVPSYLVLLMAVQAACWILSPVLTNDAPPLDVVENTVWGTEHIIASYKNPGLSYALLEAARIITGDFGWPAYVLSQIAVCLTYLIVFLLGRGVLGPERALLGTMLLAACYYFGWHTPEFNQDIVQMPLWAGVSFTLWRAVETNRIRYWIGLGLFAAAATYGKLSAGLILISAASWLLADARARGRLAGIGPWLALGLFVAALAPLLLWLADGGFRMITEYAVGRGRNKFGAIQFVLFQLAVVVPMLLVMLWSAGFRRPSLPAGRTDDDRMRRFVRFLVWMTAGPILIAVLAVTFMRTGTKLMWGVPMLNLTGLLMVAVGARDVTSTALRRGFVSAVVFIMLNATGVAMTTRYGNQFRPVPDRQNWPQQEISTRLREIWRRETGQPLKIVAGEGQNWVSGLIALSHEGIASVFTSANYKISPWISPERLAREGALVVWPNRVPPPVDLQRLTGGVAPRYETFALRHPGIVREVVIGYVVVPPAVKADASN